MKSLLFAAAVVAVVLWPESLAVEGANLTAQMQADAGSGGGFRGQFCYTLDDVYIGWEIVMEFNTDVRGIQAVDGVLVGGTSGCSRRWVMANKPYSGIHQSGFHLCIRMSGSVCGGGTAHATGTLINLSHDTMQNIPPAPTVAGAQSMKYNYPEVLQKSILFYEAQRSGKLPHNNRIPWRGDSAVHDHGANGEDLTGGWYDAGDNVKFNFPMAFSTTLLCWGLLEYKEAYSKAGQLDHMYDCIRWPLEYLVKCHTKPNELYVQVGNGQQDHTQWTSPELMDDNRPAYKVDASHPGSDVADETAAAMACGYLAFKEKVFQRRPIFTRKSIHYESNNYTDELVWGGLWLHKATGENSYLQDAQASYEKGPAWGFSWDEKLAGNMVLMCDATHGALGKDDVVATMVAWSPGPDGFGPPFTYTPKCLAWRLQWGALRYSANTAFVALLAAKRGLNKSEYNQWAMCQIHYALGDAGRSFVCGFGKNPPTQPHHRGASCPVRPAPCNWEAQQNPGPNPHVLYGALVGGPGNHDDYTDSRMDFTHNEVACDYNAGFQGAVAGLLQLAIDHELPDPTSCGHC
ncbi:hypothetical protein BaRGS_00032663 [Batillaria attramentaria]|uniref:Endoglucanase n=1 Tax=Batillaria attramentaria TaxID=370345 RepID=A0ABD0JMQ0_9CAEN